jgi:hypothetical protein
MKDLIRIDRRTTLSWLGGAVAGANLAVLPAASAAAGDAGTPMGPAKGYGNDPDLLNPTIPWPRTMSARQLQLSAVLADLILPPTGTAPAPSAVGIPDFVDEWVSAPYPDQQRDRGLILPGLLWLDAESAKQWGKPFTDVPAARQLQILTDLAMPPATTDQGAAARYGFFNRFRSISVGAYYSLEQNFEEIGYIGNKPLDAFPPPTAEELAFINTAIAKLGL